MNLETSPRVSQDHAHFIFGMRCALRSRRPRRSRSSMRAASRFPTTESDRARRVRHPPHAEPGGDVLVANATVVYTVGGGPPPSRRTPPGHHFGTRSRSASGLMSRSRLRALGRGRFSAQLRTPRGESAREYVVADGALILDDDVFHQYYFVARRPHRRRAGRVRAARPAHDARRERRRGSVTIGGNRIAAPSLCDGRAGRVDGRLWTERKDACSRFPRRARHHRDAGRSSSLTDGWTANAPQSRGVFAFPHPSTAS